MEGLGDEERHALPWNRQDLMLGISQEAQLGWEDALYQMIRERREELKSSHRALI